MSRKKETKPRLDVTGTLPMTGLIFVYGTLKRAYRNYEHTIKGAKFVGEATTLEPYPMVCSEIPFLYNIPGKGHIVKGEVFNITNPDMMEQMDRLESHPHGYRRTPFKVKLQDGKVIDVFVYFVESYRRDFNDDMLRDCKSEFHNPGAMTKSE